MEGAVATDPNWLLSTSAQSAAALVAIVGGFLVSRLVSLASEKQALERRLAELQGRLLIARGRLEEVYEERHAVSVEWFERAVLPFVIKRRGDVSAEEAFDEFFPRGATEQELEPVATMLAQRVRELLKLVDDTGISSPDRLRELGYDLTGRDTRIVTAIARSRQSHSSLAPPFISRSRDDSEIERQDRRIEREEDLDADVRALEAEAEVLRTQLRSVAAPPRLKLAVGVLVYFAFVSIVLPLWWMTRRPVPHGPELRLAVVVLFASGLGALLYYVWTSIRELAWSDADGVPDQPPEPEDGTFAP
ncbi:MAG: hypothetical protein ACOYXM_07600 [Actinomycetota bacterium]